MTEAELGVPSVCVRGDTALDELEVLALAQLGLLDGSQGLADGHGLGDSGCGCLCRLPIGQSDQVAGATSLGTGANGGLLPTTEGLTLNDCTGNCTVDVQVTCLDLGEPQLELVSIQRVQTCGQAVIGCVLQLDCLFQGLSGHDAQDGAEVLGHVVLGTGLDAFANTGAPQATGLVQFLGLNEPALARAEGGQTA